MRETWAASHSLSHPCCRRAWKTVRRLRPARQITIQLQRGRKKRTTGTRSRGLKSSSVGALSLGKTVVWTAAALLALGARGCAGRPTGNLVVVSAPPPAARAPSTCWWRRRGRKSRPSRASCSVANAPLGLLSPTSRCRYRPTPCARSARSNGRRHRPAIRRVTSSPCAPGARSQPGGRRLQRPPAQTEAVGPSRPVVRARLQHALRGSGVPVRPDRA